MVLYKRKIVLYKITKDSNVDSPWEDGDENPQVETVDFKVEMEQDLFSFSRC